MRPLACLLLAGCSFITRTQRGAMGPTASIASASPTAPAPSASSDAEGSRGVEATAPRR